MISWHDEINTLDTQIQCKYTKMYKQLNIAYGFSTHHLVVCKHQMFPYCVNHFVEVKTSITNALASVKLKHVHRFSNTDLQPYDFI